MHTSYQLYTTVKSSFKSDLAMVVLSISIIVASVLAFANAVDDNTQDYVERRSKACAQAESNLRNADVPSVERSELIRIYNDVCKNNS